MIIEVKPGVRFPSADQAMGFAHSVIVELFRDLGVDVVTMTAGIEGVHSDWSSHYRGMARDYRGKHLTDGQRALIITKAQGQLGPDFYVEASNHGAIHVQWKPRGPVNS